MIKENIERARQHQAMKVQYPAYGEFLKWLDEKIATLNDTWHQRALDNDALQMLRGQKQALDDVKANLDSMHRMDVEAEMKKLEAGNGS